MSIQAITVVGNPVAGSRTRMVASMLVEELFGHPAHAREIIELSAFAVDGPEAAARRLEPVIRRVAECDVAVFASPTYKATYTGLLKSFIDGFPADGLAGVVAIPVMTGADEQHSLASTFSLAPVLSELGAVVPGRGFYFPVSHMADVGPLVTQAADRYRANIERIARLGL